MNIEQDYVKLEKIGDLTYYGYTNNLSASENDNVWSIRLKTNTISTTDNKWSNNTKFNFISKWSEKEYYFQYDGSASFGISYSLSDWGNYQWKWFEKLLATEGRTESEFNAIFDREPNESGISYDTNINWASETRPNYLPENNFAWEVTTYLKVDVSGEYVFNTISDDGNQLAINGQIVTFYYGGRGTDEGDVSEPIYLSSGYHEFRYRMEQGSGAAAATVAWKVPNSDEFVIIPSKNFNTDNTVSTTPKIYSKLSVEWNDLQGYDIYNIYITNDMGKIVNKNNIEIYNTYNKPITDTIYSNGTEKLYYTFYVPIGLTYSFTLESSNIAGKLIETFSF